MVARAGGSSHRFNIPKDQGKWVQVCVNSGNLSVDRSHTYETTGRDMSCLPYNRTDRQVVHPVHMHACSCMRASCLLFLSPSQLLRSLFLTLAFGWLQYIDYYDGSLHLP